MVSAQKKWEIPAKKRFNEWRSLIKMATPANTCLSPQGPLATLSKYKLVFPREANNNDVL